MEHKDQKNTKRAWWKTGCYMGLLCFFIMEGIDYLRYNTFDTVGLLRSFVFWMGFGLLQAYLSKRFNW